MRWIFPLGSVPEQRGTDHAADREGEIIMDHEKLKEAAARMQRAKAAMIDQSAIVGQKKTELEAEVKKLNEAMAETQSWAAEVTRLMS